MSPDMRVGGPFQSSGFPQDPKREMLNLCSDIFTSLKKDPSRDTVMQANAKVHQIEKLNSYPFSQEIKNFCTKMHSWVEQYHEYYNQGDQNGMSKSINHIRDEAYKLEQYINSHY